MPQKSNILYIESMAKTKMAQTIVSKLLKNLNNFEGTSCHLCHGHSYQPQPVASTCKKTYLHVCFYRHRPCIGYLI